MSIPSKAIILELQPVTVDDKLLYCKEQEEQQDIFKEIQI